MLTMLATKQGLELLRRDIASAQRELKQDMAAMRQSIIIQLGSIIAAGLTIAVAVTRFWH